MFKVPVIQNLNRIGHVMFDKILHNDPILDDEWMVTVKFQNKEGVVFVKGFGKTKEQAFGDFLAELEEI